MANICHQVYVPAREVTWNPPEQGYVKLNFDGGLKWNKSSAISAGIFRDHNGMSLFSYAFADVNYSGRTAYDGEMNAMFIGLCIARQYSVKKLWIEGDAKFLIEVIEGKRRNTWYDEQVLGNIRTLLASFVERPRLTFIYREGNTAADALVKYVHDNPENSCLWLGYADLPMAVDKIIDLERHGYTYTRKASTFDHHSKLDCTAEFSTLESPCPCRIILSAETFHEHSPWSRLAAS